MPPFDLGRGVAAWFRSTFDLKFEISDRKDQLKIWRKTLDNYACQKSTRKFGTNFGNSVSAKHPACLALLHLQTPWAIGAQACSFSEKEASPQLSMVAELVQKVWCASRSFSLGEASYDAPDAHDPGKREL